MIAVTTVSSESSIAKRLIYKWATTEDHAQIRLSQSKARQHDFLLARATLRALLVNMSGTGDWQIQPDNQGKPQALSVTGITGPFISLSHTQGLVACAVSKVGPLGIDVEHWRERNFLALADYAFGPCERNEVARDGMSAFYRIWTLREAIAKATGKGLLSTLDGCDSVAGAPVSGYWAAKEWQLFYSSQQTNYSLAIASQDEDIWSEATIIWTDAAKIY